MSTFLALPTSVPPSAPRPVVEVPAPLPLSSEATLSFRCSPTGLEVTEGQARCDVLLGFLEHDDDYKLTGVEVFSSTFCDLF